MQSYWEKELIVDKTDITIIGAGFSGLWTAFFLIQQNPELKIQILDKEPLPKGASTRNAGFACFGSVGELLLNFDEFGEDKALYWATERWRGIQLIKKYFGEKADFQKCGGFELFEDEEEAEKCLNVMPKLNTFFADLTHQECVYQEMQKTVKSFGFRGYKHAILNTEEGSLNSGKLVVELVNYVLQKGVKISRGVSYESHLEQNDEVLIESSFGEMRSRHLCFATNAFSPDAFGISPGRGQILLTKPLNIIPFDGTFHVDKGYTYFRNVGSRILLGGGRNIALKEEATTAYAVTETIQHYLENLLLARILPGQRVEVENRWAGIMGFTENHEPLCEIRSPHVSVIAGMNGMGVALAPRLAEILAEEIIESM